MNQCPTCNQAVSPGSRFCPNCGTVLNQVAAIPNPPTNAPQVGYPQQPGYPQQAYPYQAPPIVIVQQPPKSNGTAVAVEVVAAYFGLYGIGWMMSGKTGTGVVLLLGGWTGIIFLYFAFFNAYLNSLTSAFAGGGANFGYLFLFFIPLLIGPVISGVTLSNRLKNE